MTAATALLMPSAISADQDAAVAVADDLFARHGVGPVSLGDVAQQAGLSPDALQHAFPDPHDLVVAALRHRHRSWFNDLVAHTRGHEEPREELLAVFSYLETTFADDTWRGCAFVNGYGELGRDDPAIADLADAHLSRIEGHIAVLCGRAGLPDHVADGLTLLIQGAQVEAAIHRSTSPARRARLVAATLIATYDTRDSWF